MLGATKDLRRTPEMMKELNDAMLDPTFPRILQDALAYAQQEFALAPAGKTATIRTISDVKNSTSNGCLFSGSLGQLSLSTNAVAVCVDFGRLRKLNEDSDTMANLISGMGPIVINLDAWSATTQAGLLRAHLDSEIQIICLQCFLLKNNVESTALLKVLLADLVFDGQHFGHGAAFLAAKMALIQKDEARRAYTGIKFSSLWESRLPKPKVKGCGLSCLGVGGCLGGTLNLGLLSLLI